jgi:hypothetical protein
MATVTTITYNGTATAITFTTLSSLTSTLLGGASGILVDNTANKYVDYEFTLKIIMPAGLANGPWFVGVGASTDGTNFGNPYVGTDAAISLLRPVQFPTNLAPGPGGSLYFGSSQIFYATFLDMVGYAASPTVFISVPSVASVCGSPNVMPLKWGPYVLNYSGQTSAAACTATQTGITYTNT